MPSELVPNLWPPNLALVLVCLAGVTLLTVLIVFMARLLWSLLWSLVVPAERPTETGKTSY